MNEYINIYNGTVTNGLRDGEAISLNNEQTNPLNVTLEASNGETKYVKCAIRCEDGYQSTHTVISFSGITQEKWQVALDDNYSENDVKNIDFSSTLDITSIINNTNTLIWFKISSSADEKPRRDTTVSIKLDSYIIAI